jgi:beta-phosphoglucomutase-like phosphatase (HAD superfamily)
MHITFIKKITASGEACRKCADVEQRLRDSGYWDCIDTILVADERKPDSAGVHLAAALGVDKAPFFVVEDEQGQISVYTIYFKFVREVLERIEHVAPTYEIACA